MKYISLAELYFVAKTKPAGFLAESLKRGKIKNNCLELSESDFDFLKKYSTVSHSSVSSKSQKVEVAESKTVDAKIENSKEEYSYNFSNTKQFRLAESDK